MNPPRGARRPAQSAAETVTGRRGMGRTMRACYAAGCGASRAAIRSLVKVHPKGVRGVCRPASPPPGVNERDPPQGTAARRPFKGCKSAESQGFPGLPGRPGEDSPFRRMHGGDAYLSIPGGRHPLLQTSEFEGYRTSPPSFRYGRPEDDPRTLRAPGLRSLRARGRVGDAHGGALFRAPQTHHRRTPTWRRRSPARSRKMLPSRR